MKRTIRLRKNDCRIANASTRSGQIANTPERTFGAQSLLVNYFRVTERLRERP